MLEEALLGFALDPSNQENGGEDLEGSYAMDDGATSAHQRGNPILHIPLDTIRNIEIDYEARLFVPRPPIEVLRTWIKNHWEAKGIQVALTQAIKNNSYQK